jgi:phosphopantetheine--protein transferase-like protein
MSSLPGTGQASHATRKVITVGADLADVTEVRKSLRNFGESYLERVFTSSEASYGLQAADPATELACMFAVKEAVVKVLADVQLPWTAIEVASTALLSTSVSTEPWRRLWSSLWAQANWAEVPAASGCTEPPACTRGPDQEAGMMPGL